MCFSYFLINFRSAAFSSFNAANSLLTLSTLSFFTDFCAANTSLSILLSYLANRLALLLFATCLYVKTATTINTKTVGTAIVADNSAEFNTGPLETYGGGNPGGGGDGGGG